LPKSKKVDFYYPKSRPFSDVHKSRLFSAVQKSRHSRLIAVHAKTFVGQLDKITQAVTKASFYTDADIKNQNKLKSL